MKILEFIITHLINSSLVLGGSKCFHVVKPLLQVSKHDLFSGILHMGVRYQYYQD